MLWAVWIALAFAVGVTVVAAWFAVREALAFWRTFRAFTALLGHAADVLGARADEAARKAGSSGDAVAKLTVSVERLSRSLAYARAISGAGGGALAAYSALRGRVPRK
jgi:hypothetical protein